MGTVVCAGCQGEPWTLADCLTRYQIIFHPPNRIPVTRTHHREQGPGGLSSRPLQRLRLGADATASGPLTTGRGAAAPDVIT
jgi:hypothetical protein